ncbi:Galactosyltransferase [Novymonas esmeraldas]|uniref:Galactosyltransferase n=1 Tax=Novymonas esmeraldas TaxID=1808958 RepID=A0AAW0F339_9TRYP
MSQKLILWLEYAYHAFPAVPFIVKGDDDMYMKVPQFLSDVRYVMGGTQVQRRRLPLRAGGSTVPPPNTTVTSAAVGAGAPALPSSPDDVECVYWGSLRHFLHTQFNAGMTFMLHRRVVQALLEPKKTRRLDVVRLAAEDFTVARTAAYRRIMFHHEDILTGLQVHLALRRVKQLCPNGRLWYVKEWYARFHDMHAGRTHNVTWSTVVAHRCRPADAYYLHRFFQTEHTVAAAAAQYPSEDAHEAAAVAQAARWVAQARRDARTAALNWSGLPDVQWARNISHRRPYAVADGDGVAVYDIRYEYWTHAATNIQDGFRSLPQW